MQTIQDRIIRAGIRAGHALFGFVEQRLEDCTVESEHGYGNALQDTAGGGAEFRDHPVQDHRDGARAAKYARWVKRRSSHAKKDSVSEENKLKNKNRLLQRFLLAFRQKPKQAPRPTNRREPTPLPQPTPSIRYVPPKPF